MADTKISALTAASTPLAGTEVLPIVQSGTTVKVAVSDLTAGRAVSASSVTVTTGDVVIGTAGKGIDFSATPGTGTSELLDDYEEGTWSPTLFGSTTAGTNTYLFANGKYTKIGRQVVLQFKIRISSTSSMAGNLRLGGLPFTADTGNDFDSAINIGEWGNLASSVNFMAGVIPQGQVYANLNATTAASANLSAMSVSVFQNASYIIGTAVYVTAS
jgi:hypothetical protein